MPALRRGDSQTCSYLSLVATSSSLPTSRDEGESFKRPSWPQLTQDLSGREMADRFFDVRQQSVRNSQHRKEKFNVVLNEPLVYAQ